MCFGDRDDEDGEARSREVDGILRRDAKRIAEEVKLLLLGAGEAGKSTVLKQMKLIYSRGFSVAERQDWKPIIYGNLVQAFHAIHDAMRAMHIQLDNAENEAHMALLLEEQRQVSHQLNTRRDLLDAIKILWKDSGVIATVHKGNDYALHDNFAYFIDDIDRLWSKDYIPNDQDLLRARLRTTGIQETKFDLSNVTFRVIDVGGQRSERRKWITCFENVHSVLFIVAISGYNRCLVEDQDANQMNEALMLWESIVNSIWFTKSAMIIFLNKMDLFKKKLAQYPITNYSFTDYKGPPKDYKTASNYFLQKFIALNRNPQKIIYGHFTNATDTNLLKVTMAAVQDMIVQQNMKEFLF